MEHATATLSWHDVPVGSDVLLEEHAGPATLPQPRPFSRDWLAAAMPRGQRHRLEKGESIYLAADLADVVRVLAGGRVKVVYEAEDGHEVILWIVQAGQLLNAAAGEAGAGRATAAVALEPALVVEWPRADFDTLLRSDPSVAIALLECCQARLREMEARLCDLQTVPVERRIARGLLRLAHRSGAPTSAGVMLNPRLSRDELAQLWGTTGSTVSRVLSAWARCGVIVLRRRRIEVTRMTDLHRLAFDDPDGDGIDLP